MTANSREVNDCDFLTNQEAQMFDTIIYVFVCTAVCLFGVVANTINIIIFCKQGFANTVNISFCSLALSDMGCLVTQIGYSVLANPLLERLSLTFVPREIRYATNGLPTVCFSRITIWITVFITAERCLSIATPLKVKQIVTAKRTVYIIVLAYLMNFVLFCTEYAKFYWNWTFYPEKNQTLFGMVIRDTSPDFDRLSFSLGAVTGVLPVAAVAVFTAILVVKLGENSAWRKKATIAASKTDPSSSRERKTVKMIVLIAIIMIVCFIPSTALSLVSVFEPEFSILGKYGRTFVSIWSIPMLFQEVNSSINIFLYYKMSTKYRNIFLEMFTQTPCMAKRR